DLAARLREPGHEHEGMLESEMAAAVAGGVTSLVCPPDTEPVLDEPGLVQMLKFRARNLNLAHLYPLGALTRGLNGEVLTAMAELTDAGCVGFSQAEVAMRDTLVLHRALMYAATFGYTTWLRPNDAFLGTGVAAKGALATRMGLAGVPAIAETIALNTIFELVRDTGARVHLCRLSSAAGIELVRRAKAERLPVTCDVSEPLARSLATITSAPVAVLGESLGSLASSAGRLVEGGVADLCLFRLDERWTVSPASLKSQGKHTPFAGHELAGRVKCTLVS